MLDVFLISVGRISMDEAQLGGIERVAITITGSSFFLKPLSTMIWSHGLIMFKNPQLLTNTSEALSP